MIGPNRCQVWSLKRISCNWVIGAKLPALVLMVIPGSSRPGSKFFRLAACS
jgi:hypothetical protein